MTSPQPTGNPVFDYKAGFRVFAQKIQSALLLGGLLLLCGCGPAWLFARLSERLRLICGIAALCGPVLMMLGVLWGFYWRKHLRAEFRREYGTGSNRG